MVVAIYVEYAPGEYDRLDMFDDEKISIKFKVKDSADIGKMFSTYSQTFTVPASDKNNRLLDYFFDTTVVRSSNKYINAKLFVNDTLFKLGKIGLNEAAMKYNAQSNYNINFFTGLSTLKDLVGDDLLSDIFGNNKCFNYWNPNGVYSRLTGLNFNANGPGTIAFANFAPLVSNKRVLTYGDAGPNDIKVYNNTVTTKHLGVDELRPAVGVYDILSAIIQHYDLDIDLTYFTSGELPDIYVHCNGADFKPEKYNFKWLVPYGWDEMLPQSNEPSAFSIGFLNDETVRIDYNPTGGQYATLCQFTVYIPKNNIFGPNSEGNYLKYKFIDKRTATFGNILAEGIAPSYTIAGIPYFAINTEFDWVALNMGITTLDFGIEIETNFFFDYQYNPGSGFYGAFARLVTEQFNPGYGIEQYSYQNQFISSTAILAMNKVNILKGIPKIKVIDFLSSLFKMFNTRVVEPLNGTSKYSYWISGNAFYTGEVDYSDYIDSTAHTIKPPDIYKTLSFGHKQGKYRSSVDWSLANAANPNSKEYGQLLYNTGNQYDKNTYEIKTAFTIVPNVRLFGSNIVTWYAFTNDDGTPNTTYGTLYKPNIEDITLFCYNGTASVTNTTGGFGSIGLKGIIGQASNTFGVYNRTSLANLYQPSTNHMSIGFKDEVSVAYPSFVYTNNLYSKYYAADISRLYNPNTKIYTFEGYLPADKILSFSLRNRVIIGNQKYTIEEADIDITTGKCKLVLMNYAPVNVNPSVFTQAPPVPPITFQGEIL